VIAWVTDARTAFLTGSGGYEATELARLRDAVRAASDEDGSVRQFCIVLAKYEACASQERQRPPLVYREGEIRTETEKTTIDGSFERTARVFADTHIVRFSAYGRIARGPASDALKSIVQSTSVPAGSNETTFHLRWASDDLPEKRIAQLTRALRVSNEQRDEARENVRFLEEPALKWFRKSAEQGDADAQLTLGIIYYEGKGVARDLAESAKWYSKSADQGDAYAQLGLGYMYYEGKGVVLDRAEAAKWYRRSAEQGDADAQLMLGHMYYQGTGVDTDKTEAAKWYRKSADQGNTDAQFWLGLMYYEGVGLTLDLKEAAGWFRIAGDRGDQYALQRRRCSGRSHGSHWLRRAPKWYERAKSAS
jgi:hypothetical protein